LSAAAEGKGKNTYVYSHSPALVEELRRQNLGWLADGIPFEFSKNTGIPKDVLRFATACTTTGNSPIMVSQLDEWAVYSFNDCFFFNMVNLLLAVGSH